MLNRTRNSFEMMGTLTRQQAVALGEIIEAAMAAGRAEERTFMAEGAPPMPPLVRLMARAACRLKSQQTRLLETDWPDILR